MSETRKVNFTLPGGATFNAEGTEQYVDKLLAEFKTLLERPAPASAPATPFKQDPLSWNSAFGNPFRKNPSADEQSLPLERLFSQDDYYGVALLAKPKTDDPDADGVLALLYGFAALRKETTVTALRLQRAAKKSGLDTPRLNRTIAKHASFITESGKGKGKCYGLNNPGATKAVEILSKLLG
ncbi:MAG TPA: hypothetical protein VL225_21165 [Vicinamibacterales bacterium]|jgi:hypothetical protein|nr:hypothetical protein [Vicinamibacterales bacterium]